MKKKLMKTGFLLIFIAVVLLFAGRNHSIASFKQPVDLFESNISELGKSDNIHAEVYGLLDYAGTLTTTTTKNGSVVGKSEDYYYILPVFEGEDTYYMAIEVPSQSSSTYDTIVDNTWYYLMGETDTLGEVTADFEGTISDLDDDMYKYMVEWFEEAEWFEDSAEIDKYVLPLVLTPVNMNRIRTTTIIYLIILLVGIILLVLGFLPVLTAGKKNLNTFQNHEKPVDGSIIVGGFPYPKDSFRNVNAHMMQGDKAQALQEFITITGAETETAENIINNWNMYYN